MEVQLTIEQPNGSVSHHRFNEEPVTIGSAIANHIVFDDADLAPHQLIIFREKETWVIRSLAQGLEIVCDDRVLAHGETYPLNLEATIKMGEYSVLWCAEAAPEGVQNPRPSGKGGSR